MSYYEILGVAKDADQPAIKKAYMKAAIRYHPDKNPDDPTAEEKVSLQVSGKRFLTWSLFALVQTGERSVPGAERPGPAQALRSEGQGGGEDERARHGPDGALQDDVWWRQV